MNKVITGVGGFLVLIGLWVGLAGSESGTGKKEPPATVKTRMHLEKAIFAGGCFWCMEPPFEKLDGVISVTSGYTGGTKKDPTYEEVSAGGTGHVEAVEIVYEPERITYPELLEVFWRNIDPTDADGQFVDRGSQYRSAIFFFTDEQRRLAEESREKLAQSGRFERPIVTEILKASTFYPAENYHQDYYKENPLRYRFYRFNSGRDQFLDRIWGESRAK